MVGTLMENPNVYSLLNLTKLFVFRSWNYQFITTLIPVDSKVSYLCHNSENHTPRLGDPAPAGDPDAQHDSVMAAVHHLRNPSEARGLYKHVKALIRNCTNCGVESPKACLGNHLVPQLAQL